MNDWMAAAQAQRAFKKESGLSTRVANCLWNECEERGWPYPPTKERIAGLSDQYLLRLPNFGKTSLAELRAWHGKPMNTDKEVAVVLTLDQLETLIQWACMIKGEWGEDNFYPNEQELLAHLEAYMAEEQESA